MSHLIFSVIIFITLTAMPLSIIVGIITDDAFRNVFAYAMTTLFIYIGVKAWLIPTRKK